MKQIEQKPRIIYSFSAFHQWGEGWICYFFEGACTHKTFEDAINCVASYYNADRLIAAQPLTESVQ